MSTHEDVESQIDNTIMKGKKMFPTPTITNIINMSRSTGIFPNQYKSYSKHPPQKN